LYRSTDRLCRCGAAVKNLAHSASFHSLENNAPSNPGIKHLAAASAAARSLYCSTIKLAARQTSRSLTASITLHRFWLRAPVEHIWDRQDEDATSPGRCHASNSASVTECRGRESTQSAGCVPSEVDTLGQCAASLQQWPVQPMPAHRLIGLAACG